MEKEFVYYPKGTCSTEMHFIIDENDVIKDLTVIRGCDGNLKGIKALLIGMKVDDVINKLSGIKCRIKDTSCPDQIACGLKEYKKENEKSN